jgi:uncharacterized protein YjbI with pentapeptide repeats
MDLSRMGFPGADFGHASLVSTDFSGTDLRLARFTDADLENASFAGVDLSGTLLAFKNLGGLNFAGRFSKTSRPTTRILVEQSYLGQTAARHSCPRLTSLERS